MQNKLLNYTVKNSVIALEIITNEDCETTVVGDYELAGSSDFTFDENIEDLAWQFNLDPDQVREVIYNPSIFERL